ncbi:uncharacterized protein LTR77_002089 [Saxophila tyrrhenica]|uniref:Glutathione S-transferase kappa n=1 Tax=Saxophila tyrrhenica TaxID=1690608 RepID=A0AAV9PM70_9PEZI|nr:hypothetical protein LTR77_002089 [Saxophila tyrrhenica]
MAPPKLTLFLDIISPFAYIAFHVTRNSPVFKNCEVTYVPIFLGGVMKACGNTAPIEIKNKDKWINLERRRWQRAFNIPMLENSPQPFPQPTLNPQRALCAIQSSHPAQLTDCFAALYQAFWVEGQTIGKPEIFGPVLEKVLGVEAAKGVLEAAKGKEAKERLSGNSDWAMDEGAFGLPWFVATDGEGRKECFWGVDHLGQVVEHLGLDRGKEAGLRAML